MRINRKFLPPEEQLNSTALKRSEDQREEASLALWKIAVGGLRHCAPQLPTGALNGENWRMTRFSVRLDSKMRSALANVGMQNVIMPALNGVPAQTRTFLKQIIRWASTFNKYFTVERRVCSLWSTESYNKDEILLRNCDCVVCQTTRHTTFVETECSQTNATCILHAVVIQRHWRCFKTRANFLCVTDTILNP